MITQPFERTVSRSEGRLAPIFLSYEPRFEDIDLFKYSKLFHEQHQSILQAGYGVVSGLLQSDYDGTPLPRETIVFDARSGTDGIYSWELCYADGGAQQVVRLETSQDYVDGKFAKTSVQGSLTGIFELMPEEAFVVGRRLLSRLESPEIQSQINDVYERRLTISRNIVHLINKQAAEDRIFALKLKVNKPPRSSMFTEQIKTQKEQEEKTGFTTLQLFRPEWLEE